MKPTESTKPYKINKKTAATQFDKYFEIFYKKCQKKKKKKYSEFFYTLTYYKEP